jgi:hypothetical protein
MRGENIIQLLTRLLLLLLPFRYVEMVAWPFIVVFGRGVCSLSPCAYSLIIKKIVSRAKKKQEEIHFPEAGVAAVAAVSMC